MVSANKIVMLNQLKGLHNQSQSYALANAFYHRIPSSASAGDGALIRQLIEAEIEGG